MAQRIGRLLLPLAGPPACSCLSCHVLGGLTEALLRGLGDACDLKPTPAERWAPVGGAVIKGRYRSDMTPDNGPRVPASNVFSLWSN